MGDDSVADGAKSLLGREEARERWVLLVGFVVFCLSPSISCCAMREFDVVLTEFGRKRNAMS